MVATLAMERSTVTDRREKRDPRLYTIDRLFGREKRPGLLDNWHQFAIAGTAPEEETGYTGAIGRSNVPTVAAFEKLAAIYADLDSALPRTRQGEAVRLYFRGVLDTDPKSPTFGLFVKPDYGQVRFALRCAKNSVPGLIYWGLVDLVVMLCGEDQRYAEYRTEKWWKARNHGWEKTKLP